MPQIIPIKDLKNTNEISEKCKAANEPIFITKNGYGEMVIMSMETYDKTMFMNELYRKLDEAERSIANGGAADGFELLRAVRGKYGLQD